MIRKLAVVFCLGLLVTACSAVTNPGAPTDTSAIEQIQREIRKSEAAAEQKRKPVALPASVTNALMPPVSEFSREEVLDRFDVVVNEVEARDFFYGIVRDTGYSMIVHPEVSGLVSLNLQGVTVEDVMAVVKDVYGYPYKKRGRLYQVMPAGLQTEVFKIDYLNIRRQGTSQTQVTSGSVSDVGSTRSSNTNAGAVDNENGRNFSNESSSSSGGRITGTQIRTSAATDFWSELTETLNVLIGNGSGQTVVVTPQAGIVVVKAFADELDIVRDYLRRAELILRRQVILEAKILEVDLGSSYQSGINWNQVQENSGNTLGISIDGGSVAGSGVFGLTVETGDFTGILELLETQGSVQVLSSPRISTLNNQKAVIKVGQDEFFVTDVTNSSISNSGGVTNNPSVELTPFFSGIALDVTPQISGNDEIILHIHPSISEVEDQVKVIAFGDGTLELPLALSTIRESDSIVFAQSGQVVVIGGLMQSKIKDANSGLPGAKNAPLIGGLFNQKNSTMVKSELVILLRPEIIDPANMSKRFRDMGERFESYRDEMNPGYTP